jgi:Mrp family chromosome partitioning ATPase
MAAERFVVLGLAPARSAWFRSVGLWANSGALPAEFVRCISVEEVRARLSSGRPFSALVADAGLPAVDRDLLAAARSAGCAVLVVDDGRATRDWLELGAARVLLPSFGREELVAALTSCAHPVRRGDVDAADLLTRPAPAAWRGSVAAVTGSGGTGVSTAAIALAQALADDVRHGGMVLLADLRLRAEHAVLHDAGDVLPCVQELVEAHRSGQPTADDVRALAFAVPERRYHVLLGLRRARHWPAIRPQAFEAAFDSLRRAWGVVVCDIDADLEGEDDAGSIDIEERNVMSRTAAAQADVVFAVGLPELKGVHALVRVLEDLVSFGTDVARIVPVINRAPRSARARAGLASVVAELTAPFSGGRLMNPVHLPERGNVEVDLRDGARLPSALGAPLAGAFKALLDRPRLEPVAAAPEPVRPGSLGQWTEGALG